MVYNNDRTTISAVEKKSKKGHSDVLTHFSTESQESTQSCSHIKKTIKSWLLLDEEFLKFRR